MSDQPALPQPGDLFASRYRVATLLGKGGFGAVFQARDTSLERDVALKVLLRVTDEQSLARFLREARATAALSSEHVATIYEVGSTTDGPYLVMELLRGCDLQDELDDKHHLPVETAVDHVLQAALGVAHAHARGIIHRDLKPRNLFLARRDDGTMLLKVLDFGIAKSTATDLTQTGATLGTPRYMAPEQLRSARTVDARTDVWALGVVLYELLSGKPIFDGDTATEFAVSIVIEPHVPLRTRSPDLPAQLEAIVDRCLAKDPDERYADVHALAVALAPFATATGKTLAPRIERALRDRTSGATQRSTTALDETVVATGTEATIAAPPHKAIATASPATRPLATAETVVAASTNPRSDATPRPSRVPIVVALVAVAAIAIVVAMWMRGSGTKAVADAPVVAIADSPPSPDIAELVVTVDAPEDVAAPIDVARAAVVTRTVPAKPGKAEIERIKSLCFSNNAPLFLVAGNDGPMPLQCERMASLGCAGVARGCRTRPAADAERKICRDFQDKLTSAGACK